MASVTSWMLAVLALLPAFAIPALAACRGTAASRFVAAQLASAIALPILVLMTFVFDQSSLIDLPLTLALLNLPGALIIALFMSRWI